MRSSLAACALLRTGVNSHNEITHLFKGLSLFSWLFEFFTALVSFDYLLFSHENHTLVRSPESRQLGGGVIHTGWVTLCTYHSLTSVFKDVSVRDHWLACVQRLTKVGVMEGSTLITRSHGVTFSRHRVRRACVATPARL